MARVTKLVEPEPLVPTSKVAEFLSIAEQTLINWRSAETGPPYHKLGRTIRYRLSEVVEWAESQKATKSA